MASDGAPITLSATQPAAAGHGSGAAATNPAGGKLLPASGTPLPTSKAAITARVGSKPAAKATLNASTPGNSTTDGAAAAKTTPPATPPDLRTLVTQLNKHLHDSGRPNQFRVDPQSSTRIQEVNPATGEVIGEFSASEFPALARSTGTSATGLLVDSLA
jgi:mevalonate pyrophosphate decarboxylase